MICTSYSGNSRAELERVIADSDLTEIRLDLCAFSEDELKEIIGSNRDIIITNRKESLSPAEEKQLLDCIDWGAEYADADINLGREFLEMLGERANKAGTKLIASYHNYTKTPSTAELQDIYMRCAELKPVIIKIACMANSADDCARLLSLYAWRNERKGKYDQPRLICFGMGEQGKISRIASLYLGAPFAYASQSEGKETAPGQYTTAALKTICKMIDNV